MISDETADYSDILTFFTNLQEHDKDNLAQVFLMGAKGVLALQRVEASKAFSPELLMEWQRAYTCLAYAKGRVKGKIREAQDVLDTLSGQLQSSTHQRILKDRGVKPTGDQLSLELRTVPKYAEQAAIVARLLAISDVITSLCDMVENKSDVLVQASIHYRRQVDEAQKTGM